MTCLACIRRFKSCATALIFWSNPWGPIWHFCLPGGALWKLKISPKFSQNETNCARNKGCFGTLVRTIWTSYLSRFYHTGDSLTDINRTMWTVEQFGRFTEFVFSPILITLSSSFLFLHFVFPRSLSPFLTFPRMLLQAADPNCPSQTFYRRET